MARFPKIDLEELKRRKLRVSYFYKRPVQAKVLRERYDFENDKTGLFLEIAELEAKHGKVISRPLNEVSENGETEFESQYEIPVPNTVDQWMLVKDQIVEQHQRKDIEDLVKPVLEAYGRAKPRLIDNFLNPKTKKLAKNHKSWIKEAAEIWEALSEKDKKSGSQGKAGVTWIAGQVKKRFSTEKASQETIRKILSANQTLWRPDFDSNYRSTGIF